MTVPARILLGSVGEDLKDHDLVSQTLLALPAPYDAFVIGINTNSPRPSFVALCPLLLSECDRIFIAAQVEQAPHMVMYSHQHTSNHIPHKQFTPYNFKNKHTYYHQSCKPPSRNAYPPKSFSSRYPRLSSSFRSDGILGVAPSNSSNKEIVACQICGLANHTTLNCRLRFDHGITSPLLHKSFTAMNLEESSSAIWYPDSGASAHMTGNSNLLHSLIPYTGNSRVMVGNSSLLSVTHTGSFSIPNTSITLSNVLVVPELTQNLISI
ncbi:hypothetical protein LIER_23391 [Lithospermum erythrorhizon]|uniref:Retrovirus-related Pol polyprotein from transposon TNT 1-94-like beta-barrel domain-containing protein n=1 Tax=Lithospermum erythrorhizon TaxID=34254 RepID=A0AAV3QX82_LITER